MQAANVCNRQAAGTGLLASADGVVLMFIISGFIYHGCGTKLRVAFETDLVFNVCRNLCRLVGIANIKSGHWSMGNQERLVSVEASGKCGL